MFRALIDFILKLFGVPTKVEEIPDTPKVDSEGSAAVPAPSRDVKPAEPSPEPEDVPVSYTPKIIDKPLSSFYEGWTRTPWAIVVHYSAGYNAEHCHKTLEKRGLSVHATIERDGTIWREVSDDNRGIHAGYGRWAGRSNMNHNAFGFEIANLGWLDGVYEGDAVRSDNVYRPGEGIEHNPQGDGKTYYRDEGGTRILTETGCAQFPDHRDEWMDKYWSLYPQEQLDAVFWLMWQWVKKYNILPENIVGHEHVTPHRKQDPGPAFPWRKWEKYLETKCQAELPELLNPMHRKRERVKAVQSHCDRMGLSVGDIDGYWGPNTNQAVTKAVKLYGNLYGFESVDVMENNCYELANALRMVPGFNLDRF